MYLPKIMNYLIMTYFRNKIGHYVLKKTCKITNFQKSKKKCLQSYNINFYYFVHVKIEVFVRIFINLTKNGNF